MTAAELVGRLADHRVLVVGDLVLDEYLTGRPSRVSREAPVLILDETEREFRAGSAGSPAANVVALGSQATIVGALGEDGAGQRLAADLARLGVGCEGLVHLPGAHTSTKTRILAQGFTGGLFGRQQVLRVDRVQPLPHKAAAQLAARVLELAESQDAILLSDYRSGVVGDEVVEAARHSGKPIFVDSQGSLTRFHGMHLVKVNQAEAQAALGSTDVLRQAETLRRQLGLHHLVVTLGADGIALFSEGLAEVIPAVAVGEVFDVTGAGDTVIAVLTLGLVAGLPLAEAAKLANAAASVVVRRLGVATASPEEIAEALGG